MTWQRIDENTYIDDTLVTCAEYQLFIDEMREQKYNSNGFDAYYQPDQWTSYQFPTGEALEPILGVRYSDANDFCAWLGQREYGDWKFRIPFLDETTDFPINFVHQPPLGCWINNEHSKHRFAWIGSPILDARGIMNVLAVFVSDRHRDAVIQCAHEFQALPLDLTLDLDEYRQLNFHFDLDLYILRDFDPAWDITKGPELNYYLDHALEYCKTQLIYDGVFSPTRRENIGCRNLAIKLYVDFFTLRERIANHAPAFEGIRLVKERIK